MSNKAGILISVLTLVLILGAGVILAQENDNSVDVTEELILDEEVQPEDLEVGDPKLLSDSPFYFLKNWIRKIQSFFTFDSVKKVELRLKFANEKLIEVKKLVEKEGGAEIIKKGIENYQDEIDEIEKVAEKIKEKAADNLRVDTFLDKFTFQQVLHHRILQKLETQVPSEVFEKIKEARERHLERFGEVMIKLENKEKIQERLEENLKEIKGSQFKNFKNLEILLELEEKVPEEAKEAIQKAQENALKRLKGDLEQMSPEDQEKFKEYLEQISGDKEEQVEILEDLEEELKESPEIQQKIIQSKNGILKKIGIKEIEESESCAQVITYRINPQTGECEQFSSLCEAPKNWKECSGGELTPQ